MPNLPNLKTPRFQKFALPILLLSWAFLLIWSARAPRKLYFDEVHYVPAARVLIHERENINPEHPPFGKFLIGASAEALGPLVSEPLSFRMPSILSGLLALAALYGILGAVGFTPLTALTATFLSSLNFLWFVQSKIATLDMISTALGLSAVYLALKKRNAAALIAWALACNSKWPALAYFPLLWLAFHKNLSVPNTSYKMIGALAAAAIAGVLMGFLFYKNGLQDWKWQFGLQAQELDMRSDSVTHPYASAFWSWPLLLRPIWYFYKETGSAANGIWAGGNPLLWALGFFGFLNACRNRRHLLLVAGYLAPLAFWAIAAAHGPQFFYYFLPASLWLGPLAVALVQDVAKKPTSRTAALALIVVFSLGFFVYFFPLLSGTAVSSERFWNCMWLPSWI